MRRRADVGTELLANLLPRRFDRDMARVGVRWCANCGQTLQAGFLTAVPSGMGPRMAVPCPACKTEIVLRCEWPEMSFTQQGEEEAKAAAIGAGVSLLVGGFVSLSPATRPLLRWLSDLLGFFPALIVLGLVAGVPAGFAVHRIRVSMSVARFARSKLKG